MRCARWEIFLLEKRLSTLSGRHNRACRGGVPRTNVRFGSKADMCNALGDVRFTPNSGRNSGHR